MKAKSITVEDFKEVMRKGMVDNFKHHGFLTPVVFFYTKETPYISEIPHEMLGSTAGKVAIAGNIKERYKKANILSCGIIIEAYAAKVDADSETAKKVIDGVVRVSELDEKQDVIIMIFSTPEKDESITYLVDCENKTVGEEFLEGADRMEGIFGNFFELRKSNG